MDDAAWADEFGDPSARRRGWWVIDLSAATREELEAALVGWGEPAYRAGQVRRWVMERGVEDVASM